MQSRWVVLMAICLTTSISFAEPDSNIKYLMDETVTMFDFGLYQLEQHLDKTVDEKLVWITKTNYNWQENRVEMLFITHNMANIQTRADMQKACQGLIDQIRNEVDSALLQKVFSHRGFTKSTSPKDIGGLIAGLSHIIVHGYYKDGKKVICNAPLVGTEVLFSD